MTTKVRRIGLWIAVVRLQESGTNLYSARRHQGLGRMKDIFGHSQKGKYPLTLIRSVKLLTTLSLIISSNTFAKTLNVGVATRFGDRYENTASRFSKGIDLAKELFEQSHPGIKITLKKVQYGSDLESIVETGNRIASTGVSAVIGGETPLEAVGLAMALNPKKIVEITPSSLSTGLTQERPFHFSTSFTDIQVGKALTQYLFEKLKPKALGLFQNLDSQEHGGVYYRLDGELKLITGTPKAIPYFSHTLVGMDNSFTNAIDSFKSQGVSHLAAFSNDVDAAKLLVEGARKNFFPVYIGVPEWGSNRYIYSRFVEHSEWKDRFVAYRYDYWKEDSNSPMSKRFRSAFKARFHELPVSWDAMAFDTAWILFTGMARAENPNAGEQIREQLRNIKDLPCVTADHFSFGSDNIPTKDLIIYKIDRDGVRYETTLR